MAIWWILGAALIRRSPGRWPVHAGPGSASDSPEAILKRGYAKDEIDRQTYDRMLGELRR